MKLLTFINLLFSLNYSIIENYKQVFTNLYKYQEMQEVRYIYFYNLSNFDINKVDIYVANRKLDYSYEYINYYKIDLENYYPLSSINVKVKIPNSTFSLKFTNEDNFINRPFAYLDVINMDNINIGIDNLIIDTPKWSKIIYSKVKPIPSKTIKIV